jgi:hypothetical protein
MIKALKKLGIEGTYLNILKDIYDISIANIKLNGEKFLIKSGTRQRCPFSPLLFNILLDFLARAINQEKELKWIQIGKEEIKLFLFADHILLHLKDPKDSPINLLDLINDLSNEAEYQLTLKNQ